MKFVKALMGDEGCIFMGFVVYLDLPKILKPDLG